MIGDKILIQKNHKVKARNVLSIILSHYKKGHKYIISIAGESGTGKTEIMLILRNLLYKKGIRTQIISLDDYYNTNWSERNRIRKEKGLDYIGKHEIDWIWLNNVLLNFKNNNVKNEIKKINKFTDSIEYVSFYNRYIDILIIEGLYACYIEQSDMRIFLEGTYQETKSFRLERKKEEQNEFRNQVLEKEHEEVEKSKHLASVIISFEGKVRHLYE